MPMTKVVQQNGRDAKKKCYIWVYCTGEHDEPIVYYEFHESRASESAKDSLRILPVSCIRMAMKSTTVWVQESQWLDVSPI